MTENQTHLFCMTPIGVAANATQVQVWAHAQRHKLPSDPASFSQKKTSSASGRISWALQGEVSCLLKNHHQGVRGSQRKYTCYKLGVHGCAENLCLLFDDTHACYLYFRKIITFQPTEWTFVSGCKRFPVLQKVKTSVNLV